MKRALPILFAVVVLAFAVRFGLTFPWHAMFVTVVHAQLGWVLLSSVANLLSTSAKAQAWALLMGTRARAHRKLAHAATFVGAAAGSIAISLGGDAMRVRWLVRRSGIAVVTAVRALVASRLIEAIALAAVILLSTGILPRGSWVRTSALFAAGALLVAAGLWWSGRNHKRMPWPKRRLARLLAEARLVLHLPGVAGALLFSALNWMLQWLSFGAAIMSVLGRCPVGYPLAALILCNVGGALKLTPANVGVLTASLLMVARPFHVLTPAAFAASIVLQAVQIVPMLLAGGILVIADRRAGADATAPELSERRAQ